MSEKYLCSFFQTHSEFSSHLAGAASTCLISLVDLVMISCTGSRSRLSQVPLAGFVPPSISSIMRCSQYAFVAAFCSISETSSTTSSEWKKRTTGKIPLMFWVYLEILMGNIKTNLNLVKKCISISFVNQMFFSASSEESEEKNDAIFWVDFEILMKTVFDSWARWTPEFFELTDWIWCTSEIFLLVTLLARSEVEKTRKYFWFNLSSWNSSVVWLGQRLAKKHYFGWLILRYLKWMKIFFFNLTWYDRALFLDFC